MNYNLNDATITIFLTGSIDSNNHNEVYASIKEILDNNSFKSIILDFKDVIYISSAGVRVMLKLKKVYGDLKIINTTSDVYEIFDMTGFNQIIDIKKALRFVSVKGKEIIGSGYFSTVYRIDPDTIVKVFNRTSDDEQIDRELRRAKDAFVSGIPTAISFDIVEVEEGKKGVQFELLNSKTLRDCFLNDTDNYEYWLKKYVHLLKTINGTECTDSTIVDIKKFYLEKVDFIKDYLGEDYDKIRNLFEGIRDSNTFIHGDCHFKNILVQGDELLLIDMDTLSKGNPIFELVALRFSYCVFNEVDPGNSEVFFGVSEELVTKLFNDIVDRYYKGATDLDKDKIALISYVQMIWWNRMENDSEEKMNKCLAKLKEITKKVNNLNIR